MTNKTDKGFLSKTVLASTLAIAMTQTCFALEALSDQSLSEATGEGIAILPQNFKAVFQQAQDSLTNAQNTATMADRLRDTGFVRIIPVGPLSATATAAGAKKADVFLYGLALSQSNADVNSRFSNIGVNIGSETNPILIRVDSTNGINYSGTTKPLSYLNVETPLMRVDGVVDPTNRMKLGLWTDIFTRSSTLAAPVVASKGAPADLTGLEQRLRLQVVANGINLDGSGLKLFQTLDGALAAGLPSSYNNTLGLNALIRINTDFTPNTTIIRSGENNTNGTGDPNKVLRVSTAESTGGVCSGNACLTTPAISGGNAPTFNANEGLYLYSPNINLVLGSIYQPLIFGTDGNNLVIELTRIPNVPAIYQQIYTRYADTDPTASTTLFKGSTCNVKVCGSNTATLAGVTYQGNNATHSSISFGTVNINATTNQMTADRTANAIGVAFKGPSNNTVNLGSVAIDGLLIQHLKITTTGL